MDSDSIRAESRDECSSYTSTEIPDNISEAGSWVNEPDEPINLHKAIVRLILMNRTFGRGRQTREWRSVQDSIIRGYNSGMEPLYYKYIMNPNCRERKKQNNYTSDFTNSAFGFKLDKKLSDLIKERMTQYCSICATLGNNSAVDQLNDIKSFIENCVECCEKTGRKIIDPDILISYRNKEDKIKRKHVSTRDRMEQLNTLISNERTDDIPQNNE